ncbi:MAG: SulP family inorganic anion transporter, partial [Cyclobacteriaceae bacterium]
LNLIPLASLAAILLVVGYKLAKPSLFKEMLRKGPGQYIPFFVTILGLIFTDLLIGVGLGLVVGIMHILWNNFKTPYHFDPNSYEVGKPVTIEMSQEVTFLNKASIQQTLNNMPEGTHLILDIKNTKYMHPDVLEIIDDFELGAPNRNIKFEVVGRGNRFDENPQAKLEKVVVEG